MSENEVQVARLGINEHLEERLIIYFRRMMESGLQEYQLNRGHELTLSTVPLPEGPPKQLCLNVKSWSDENNEQSDALELDGCRKFLKFISMLFFATVITFMAEHWRHKAEYKPY